METPKHPRKLNRLKGYDYSTPGYYFVTICTHNKIEWFGEVKNTKMIMNHYGSLAHETWQNIPEYYQNVELDEYVIMPNHIHVFLQLHLVCVWR